MLEAKGISSSYGDVPVLHEVSFHVEEGEVVSIVGSNGAGKSDRPYKTAPSTPIPTDQSGTDLPFGYVNNMNRAIIIPMAANRINPKPAE